jgi:hypothetical protein
VRHDGCCCCVDQCGWWLIWDLLAYRMALQARRWQLAETLSNLAHTKALHAGRDGNKSGPQTSPPQM